MKKNSFRVVVVILCVFVLSACSSSNRKLKPPKKSPCACYDLIIDMEELKRG